MASQILEGPWGDLLEMFCAVEHWHWEEQGLPAWVWWAGWCEVCRQRCRPWQHMSSANRHSCAHRCNNFPSSPKLQSMGQSWCWTKWKHPLNKWCSGMFSILVANALLPSNNLFYPVRKSPIQLLLDIFLTGEFARSGIWNRFRL